MFEHDVHPGQPVHALCAKTTLSQKSLEWRLNWKKTTCSGIWVHPGVAHGSMLYEWAKWADNPKLHIQSHKLNCQLNYSLNLLPGAGWTDGKDIKQLWASLNLVANGMKAHSGGQEFNNSLINDFKNSSARTRICLQTHIIFAQHVILSSILICLPPKPPLALTSLRVLTFTHLSPVPVLRSAIFTTAIHIPT